MADESIGETIAVNLVPDPRLTKTLPGGVNVNQAVLSGGMGVSLEKGADPGDAYVTPWSGAAAASGDRVCVLIVSSNDLRPDTVSMDTTDGDPLVWLRGANTGYAEVMCVRAKDPGLVRLHAPASGVLTVVKSGVFDMDSWTAMQERNIIYFDGGGIVQASESGYTLPPATTGTLGGVIVGDGLQVTAQGVLSVSPQPLPIATQDTAGVVKVGQGLRASADGTLTVRLGDNLSFDSYGNIDAAGGSGDVDLSDYYTRAQVDGKFVTKEVAEATYAKKTDIPSGGGSGSPDLSGYATQSWVESNYVSKTGYQKFKIVQGSYNASTSSGNNFFSTHQSLTAGFTSTPVICIENSNTQVNVVMQSPSSTGFTIAGYAINGGTQSISGKWYAIGPVSS